MSTRAIAAAAADDLARTASKHLQTPVSLTGMTKMIWPLFRGSRGWVAAARITGTAPAWGVATAAASCRRDCGLRKPGRAG